jgi:hypothetical protein
VKPGDSRVNLRGRMGIRFTSLAPEAMRLIETTGFAAGH